MAAFNGLHCIPDIAFTGEETKDVAFAFGHELFDGLTQGVQGIDINGFATRFNLQRTVTDLYRVGASGDLDDRGRFTIGVSEVRGEALWVNSGRSDDDLEIWPFRKKPLEVAQQEVNVEGALVGLVDNNGVVGVEETVALHFCKQNTVGHEFDSGRGRHLVIEANGVTNRFPDGLTELVGDALSDCAGSKTAGLGMANETTAPTA